MGLFSRSTNVRRIRSLVWFGALSFTVLAGWQFTEILKAAEAGDFRPEAQSSFTRLVNDAEDSADSEGPVGSRKVADYEVIWNSPINGYVKKVIDPIIPPEDNEPKFNKKPIETVVVVTSMVVDPNGGGAAYLHYKDEIPSVSLEENRVTIGSPLKYPYDGEPFNAQVVEIQMDGVVISWCGEDEKILPGMSGEVVMGSGSGDEGAQDDFSAQEQEVLNKYKDVPETRNLTELGPDSYLVGKDDQMMFGSDDEAWRRHMRVGEQTGAKGRKEVVLQTVHAEVGKRYGVKTGDVLISINGTPVVSRSGAVRYFNQNPDLGRYTVVIERLGRQISKTYYNPKD